MYHNLFGIGAGLFGDTAYLLIYEKIPNLKYPHQLSYSAWKYLANENLPTVSLPSIKYMGEINVSLYTGQRAERYTVFMMDKSNDTAISTLQVQVDDVKNVMTQNIEKVLEREERLTELAGRSNDLETAAHGFQKTTTKISRKMQWKNGKMIIIIVAVLLIIVVFIILLVTGVIPI